ncbi:hypothetical protein [Paenibacillus xylanexedens]|uniref:hypothetical protein n=1 Tax=Paenibacillus xylanexedens TaxID=528191 RepID=UPI000F5207F1|nr:hypothetical protein [Paenibacillus xylanexedens]RPK31816.1 hypothetical protein EDO6_02443 [Paenibacillus xylanexedens]
MNMVTRNIGINKDPEVVESGINRDLGNEFNVIVSGKKGDMTVKVFSKDSKNLSVDDVANIENCIDNYDF